MGISENSVCKKLYTICGALLLALMFLPVQAEASKFYVDNDYCFTGGCAWEGAWSENWGCPPEYDACYCNLEEAIYNARSGDTVEIAADQFQLCGAIYIGNKDNLTIRGKSSKPSIFGAANSEVMFEVYNSSNLTIENLSLIDISSHCVHISGESNNFTLRNLNMKDAYEGPVKVNLTSVNPPFSDNGIIENCEIGYDFQPNYANFSGADIYGVNLSGVKGTIVRNCVFKNIRHPHYDPQNMSTPIGWGIYAKGNAQDTIIENNVFENCGIAISLGNGGCDNGCPCRNNDCTYEHRGGIIRNNVVNNTLEYAIGINDSTDYKIYNNTLWSTMDTQEGGATIDIVDCNNDSNSNIANNICSQKIWCRTHGENCLISRNNNIEMADENNLAGVLFVNQPGGDLHLKSTAVEAIDQGTDSVLPDVPTDADGDVRPSGNAIDIGYDEYYSDICTDGDGDGYFYQLGCATEVDCDDGDINVHPGAIEVCNNMDDNCNGDVDEGLGSLCGTWYDDAGDAANEPHLTNGTDYAGFGTLPEETIVYGSDITFVYNGFDPTKSYRVIITYYNKIEADLTTYLETESGAQVHGNITPGAYVKHYTFNLPEADYADGVLELHFKPSNVNNIAIVSEVLIEEGVALPPWYDDAGNTLNEIHMVTGSDYTGFGTLPEETLAYGSDVIFMYNGFDPTKSYKVTLTYYNEIGADLTTYLETESGTQIHGNITPDMYVKQYTFNLPEADYADGVLELHFKPSNINNIAIVSEILIEEGAL